MWMREAGIARTGHTRLPSAARGAQLPALQGSLVWGNHLTVSHKTLTSFGATSNEGLTAGARPGSSRLVVGVLV